MSVLFLVACLYLWSEMNIRTRLLRCQDVYFQLLTIILFVVSLKILGRACPRTRSKAQGRLIQGEL